MQGALLKIHEVQFALEEELKANEIEVLNQIEELQIDDEKETQKEEEELEDLLDEL